MEYIPRSVSRTADVLIISLFSAAVCAFCIASFMTAFGGFVQVAGLILLTAAVYLAVRYRLSSFTYSVCRDGNDTCFVVYQTRGKRSVAECRISLSYLKSVGCFSSKKELAPLRDGVSVYDYTASLSPKNVCFLVFDSGFDKKTGVIIEAEGEFVSALKALCKKDFAVDGEE